MKTLLIAIDFDKGDKLLLEKAFQLANAFNSKIWIIHIAAPDPDFVGYQVGPQYIRDYRAEDLRKEHKQLQEYATMLKNKGIDADALLVQGATIEMVIGEAKKLNADLIIAGHRRHGFFHKALVGSVSADIIEKSKIPVLIVPLEK